LDALIIQQTSPDEAYRKFDDLAKKHTDGLRKLTKRVADARQGVDENELKASLKEYDDAVKHYIPVLMGQAKIYWDLENYQQVLILFIFFIF
jgi:tetratricopeptide repeat protein 30